jgi:hypothetical protein
MVRPYSPLKPWNTSSSTIDDIFSSGKDGDLLQAMGVRDVGWNIVRPELGGHGVCP